MRVGVGPKRIGQIDVEPLPVLRVRLWALVRLGRPKQWTKNGLVFGALLFSGRLVEAASVQLALWAFAAFCLASSAVYSLNDALDAPEDRLHPRKRHRPVAAGIISPGQAIAAAVLLGLMGTGLGLLVNPALGLIVALYLFVSTLYSLRLKHAVLLDILAVAAGFVLRAVGGAEAIGVQMSLWFIACVPLLSLLLAVGKRRHELVSMDDPVRHRGVLGEYPAQLLDQLIAVLSAAIIMAYLLYAMDSARPYPLMLTSPLVIYGVFRYLYLVYHRNAGGSPDELLLSDVPLLIAVAAWGLAAAAAIYLA
ncbi:MAG: decaprenyl-phosphate phosphoribosyltransferase [Armatimonadota bacterium]|nr:decaprenyl-phosphate phosphoribosyltransferase [Armatimonadota bacterium]MDR7549015.1 decaprenyl-phosphate phosphoribosyltransferase [Armatimonadota bacterium]